uniref:Uncharacterized protein n=1 Tax=Fagus sylvatica TaxID=28930 RepID=A0A2N9IWY0_FAGSY
MVLKTGPDRPVQPRTGVQSAFPPQSSRRLSLSHSASQSLTLTFSPPASHDLTSSFSRSHFRLLTVSIFHRLTLVACDLTACLRLLLPIPPLLVISPSPHACDLTATACPRSLSPTDPAKGHGTPIKLSLSLSLSHSHCQILVY